MHPDHKIDFHYLNFHTGFSVIGDDDIPFSFHSCFNEVVQEHRQKEFRLLKINDICSNEYKVFIVFNNPYQDDNNCCLLSIDELHEWITDMKRFAQFEYKIDKDDRYNGTDAVLVTLKFKDRPFAEHFLVLEMIKHSYEFAFNFSVYQAVKFRKIINENELLINLHNLIFASNIEFASVSCGDHTILSNAFIESEEFSTHNHKEVIVFRSAEEIKKALSETEALSNIFNPARCLENINDRENDDCKYFSVRNRKLMPKRTKYIIDIMKNTNYIDNRTLDADVQIFNSYFRPDKCKERLNYYIKTYENLKKYEFR